MSNKQQLQTNNANLSAILATAQDLPKLSEIQQEKSVTAGTTATEVMPDSGKLLNKVTVNPTPSETKSVTAGTSAKTVNPTSGKLLSKVTVNPTPSEQKTVTPTTNIQTITPTSGKLLSRVTVNPYVGLSPEMFDCTEMAIDYFTFSSLTHGSTQLSHSLGTNPKVAFILSDLVESGASSMIKDVFINGYLQSNTMKYIGCALTAFYNTNSVDSYYNITSTATKIGLGIGAGTSVFFKGGVEYTLITMV